jgi:hypothetical protein
MPFADDVRRFALKADGITKDVFANVVSATASSITDGSEVTGAPGQPVDTGNLKASWRTEFESPTEALISTNVVYAPVIEDGVGKYGPLTLRSEVGGFHSVSLTVAGFGALVADEARKAAP